MRFIDLEHELDHINQVWERFYFQGYVLYTQLHTPEKRITTADPEAPNLLTPWQNAIMEYHVRLREYDRLFTRGVSSNILKDHDKDLRVWSAYFWHTGMDSGHSATKKKWQERHFPDIFDWRQRVDSALSQASYVRSIY